MPLDMEVGLGPGHIALDGNPALLPQKGSRAPYFRPIFSERELTFTFAICCRPSVCLSSVTLVRRTLAVQIFGNICTALGTPPPWELNTRGVVKIATLDLLKAIFRKRCKILGKLVLIVKVHVRYLIY